MIDPLASAWRVGCTWYISTIIITWVSAKLDPGSHRRLQSKGDRWAEPCAIDVPGGWVGCFATQVTCVYYLLGIPRFCFVALIRDPSASLASSQNFWPPEGFRVSVTTGFISCDPRASTRHTFSHLPSSGLWAFLGRCVPRSLLELCSHHRLSHGLGRGQTLPYRHSYGLLKTRDDFLQKFSLVFFFYMYIPAFFFFLLVYFKLF